MKITPRYLNLKGQQFQLGNHTLDVNGEPEQDFPESTVGIQKLYESPGWSIGDGKGTVLVSGKYFDAAGRAVIIETGVTDSDALEAKYKALNLDPSLALVAPPTTWAVIFN